MSTVRVTWEPPPLWEWVRFFWAIMLALHIGWSWWLLALLIVVVRVEVD